MPDHTTPEECWCGFSHDPPVEQTYANEANGGRVTLFSRALSRLVKPFTAERQRDLQRRSETWDDDKEVTRIMPFHEMD